MKMKRFLSLLLVFLITLPLFNYSTTNAMSVINLYIGDRYKVENTGEEAIKWISSNNKVATINDKGNVSATSSGVTIITGKRKNGTLTYKINVYDMNEYLIIEKSMYEKDMYMKDIIRKLKPVESIYNDDYYSFNINKKALDFYLSALTMGLDETIEFLENMIPSVAKISFSEDYRVLNIYGTSTEFTNTEEANMSALYLSMPHYQMLTNVDFTYKDLVINYYDSLTKSIMKSVTLEEKLLNK